MLSRYLKQLLPLPISSYLIGFFTIAALLFGLASGWMLEQSNEITSLAQKNRQESAQHELHKAMDRVNAEADMILARISMWDEVYQQLGDPAFYEYWRRNRATRTGLTPSFVVALELYNAQGQSLQHTADDGLPSMRPSSSSYIQVENGTPYLYRFSFINKKGDALTVIGHLGVKLNFQQALLALNRFVYTDVASIRFSPQKARLGSINELLEQSSYTALPIAETQALEQLMRNTLLHLSMISLLLLVIAYFLSTTLLHRPLRKLSSYINAMRRGEAEPHDDEIRQEFYVTEFELLRNSIISYQLELAQMHTSLDQKNRELWNLTNHDALTGVANRRAYDGNWLKLQQLLRGQRIMLSILLVDCDHFKAINDSYGHDIGDQVIQAIAGCLQQCLRDGDHLYRIGGDEFAIHLLNTDIEAAHEFAGRCLQQLAQHDFKSLGIREPLRFSIALASARGDDHSSLNLLQKHADIAMYQAKRSSSSKIVAYGPELAITGEALSSNRFINAVYQAIESAKGIELHYQPVLTMTPECKGFHEVLVRLRDEQGLIMPNHIFPVVESEGLSVELDFAIIRTLATELRRRNDQGRYSVNIDGETLLHHDFMRHIALLRDQLQRSPGSIILEVTETALISELKEAGQRLNQLRNEGFRVALDDFGSGYSSLRYLSSMPVDIVKFDINLVRDLIGTAAQAEITGDIARMIRRIGYHLVAEGIESQELLAQVQALGFTHAQGFLFHRPAPIPIDEGQLRL